MEGTKHDNPASHHWLSRRSEYRIWREERRCCPSRRFVVWLNLATTRGTWLGPLFRTVARPEYHSARADCPHRWPGSNASRTTVSYVYTSRRQLCVHSTGNISVIYLASITARWNFLGPIAGWSVYLRGGLCIYAHLASTRCLLRHTVAWLSPGQMPGALIPRVCRPMLIEFSYAA